MSTSASESPLPSAAVQATAESGTTSSPDVTLSRELESVHLTRPDDHDANENLEHLALRPEDAQADALASENLEATLRAFMGPQSSNMPTAMFAAFAKTMGQGFQFDESFFSNDVLDALMQRSGDAPPLDLNEDYGDDYDGEEEEEWASASLPDDDSDVHSGDGEDIPSADGVTAVVSNKKKKKKATTIVADSSTSSEAPAPGQSLPVE